MIDAVQQRTSRASQAEQKPRPKIQRWSSISKMEEKGRTAMPRTRSSVSCRIEMASLPRRRSAIAMLAIRKKDGEWSRLSRKRAARTSVFPTTVAKMRTAKPRQAKGEICTLSVSIIVVVVGIVVKSKWTVVPFPNIACLNRSRNLDHCHMLSIETNQIKSSSSKRNLEQQHIGIESVQLHYPSTVEVSDVFCMRSCREEKKRKISQVSLRASWTSCLWVVYLLITLLETDSRGIEQTRSLPGDGRVNDSIRYLLVSGWLKRTMLIAQ